MIQKEKVFIDKWKSFAKVAYIFFQFQLNERQAIGIDRIPHAPIYTLCDISTNRLLELNDVTSVRVVHQKEVMSHNTG